MKVGCDCDSDFVLNRCNEERHKKTSLILQLHHSESLGLILLVSRILKIGPQRCFVVVVFLTRGSGSSLGFTALNIVAQEIR